MDILEGLLLINGTDVYTQYSAFLAETAADKHENYDALLAPPPLKAVSYTHLTLPTKRIV